MWIPQSSIPNHQLNVDGPVVPSGSAFAGVHNGWAIGVFSWTTRKMSRKTPPSFDFFPDDFIGGTFYLEAIEVGMYVRSICFQWCHNSLPNDPEKLRKIMGVTQAEFDKHWPNVEKKFERDGNGALFNARLKSEKEKTLAVIEKRREAGRLGGLSKSLANAKQKGWQKRSKGKLEVGSWKLVGGSWKVAGGSAPLELPVEIEDQALQEAWKTWVSYRKQKKAPLTPLTAELNLRSFLSWGTQRAVAAIEHTVAKGWQGLREPEPSDNHEPLPLLPED